MRSRDMLRDLPAEFVQNLGRCRALERHENADLAKVRSNLIVDVGHDRALLHFQNRSSAQRLVLTDLGDIVGQLLLNRSAARILGSAERLDVGTVLEHELGNVADEFLKQLVLGNEIRLGVHFDERPANAFDSSADETFGGGPASLLGGSRKTLGAKPVDRGFHLAVVLGERLLAVHHAGAGALAQFLHICGRDLSHFSFPLLPSRSPKGLRVGIC